jgi:2-amino-4-hydroxy-6-hydroxymethyldihydropteridine diphosphokinase
VLDYVLGLGSNLGSRAQNLAAALELLDATPGCKITRISPIYESEPVGPPQPRYLNAAARLESNQAPLELLARLHTIEVLLGRTRRQRWTARTLDLDILWAPTPVHDDALQIPHPQLPQRWFALRPMLDVAPELGAEYAPRLHELHAEPIPARSPRPRAELEKQGDALVVSSRATDAADALSSALGTLGQYLGGGERLQADIAAHRIDLQCTRGQELTAFSNAVLDAVARGHRFARVTLDALEPGHAVGRLLVSPPRVGAAHAPPPALRLTSADFQDGALRLVLHR